MKTCYFTFGRFNPPTVGHEKLIKAVRKEAASADWFIIPTQTHKQPNNPLPYQYKADLMKKMFPWAAGNIDDKACCNTIIKAAQHLMMKGYTDIVMVVGADRVNDFRSMLEKYNKKDYTFNSIKVLSAGDRDPDADGATGMSASKMREAAKNLETEIFDSGIPDTLNTDEKMQLMAKVRSGMGL